MTFELPPEPPVDTSRQGLLRIAPECLGGILGLDRRHRVIDCRMTFDGDLELTIAGEDMPPAPSGIPKPIMLIVHTAHVDGVAQPLEFCWDHQPEKRWTLP